VKEALGGELTDGEGPGEASSSCEQPSKPRVKRLKANTAAMFRITPPRIYNGSAGDSHLRSNLILCPVITVVESF